MQKKNEDDWYPIDDGKTLGTIGSERGIILQDEEYVQGARITLEQCTYPPFAITCGIYGLMFHTAFASSMEEAQRLFSSMKEGLEKIIFLSPDADEPDDEAKENAYKALRDFVEEF